MTKSPSPKRTAPAMKALLHCAVYFGPGDLGSCRKADKSTDIAFVQNTN